MHGARDTLRVPLFTLVAEARAASIANDAFAYGSDETTSVGVGPALARRALRPLATDADGIEPPPRSTMLPAPPLAAGAPRATVRVREVLPDLTFGAGADPSDTPVPPEPLSRLDREQPEPPETTERLLRMSLTELVNHYARRARARDRDRAR